MVLFWYLKQKKNQWVSLSENPKNFQWTVFNWSENICNIINTFRDITKIEQYQIIFLCSSKINLRLNTSITITHKWTWTKPSKISSLVHFRTPCDSISDIKFISKNNHRISRSEPWWKNLFLGRRLHRINLWTLNLFFELPMERLIESKFLRGKENWTSELESFMTKLQFLV